MGGDIRWGIVGVIFRREVLDQVRDRRTLFMVFALPILLYPILGIGMAQLAATFEQKPRTVVLAGAEHLPASPPLLNPARDRFDPRLFDNPREADRLRVVIREPGRPPIEPRAALEAIRGGAADAVVAIPPDVVEQLEKVGSSHIPVLFDSTDDPSEITGRRVRDALRRWSDLIVKGRLERDRKPPGYTEPVTVATEDVAPAHEAGGSLWGRMFPFLLVLMALTGAFYPAVDLCAGEKERGTMETLLISPATRAEIVLGKFFTVMLASVTTAVLNLASMGLTGIQLAASVGGMGTTGGSRLVTAITPPPAASYVWMFILLIPLAGFFSAICVALAVLARSMKEGQYYMTPLYLVTFPLTLVTLAPEISLDLFYSVVPITGVALLLKALIVGDYAIARQFFVPVLVPTILYALIALRWAVDQFRREEVVFREAEVFDLRGWLRFRLADKEATPGPGLAAFGFAAILSLSWFAGLALPRLFALLGIPERLEGLAGMAAVHVGVILGVPLALTLVFCSRPAASLRLRWPSGRDLILASGLALALNPAVRELAHLVGALFPASEVVRTQLARMAEQVPNPWVALLVFAALPAISEEVAFRGFVLAGLETSYGTRTAIVLSSFLFGFLHVLLSLFQQLFSATLLGLVLGLLAVRSRSLWPGILFHFLNNAQAVLVAEAVRNPTADRVATLLFRDRGEALFRWPVVVAGGLASAFLLVLLRKPAANRPTPQQDVVG